MNAIFTQSFIGMSGALLQILLIVVIAGILVRKGFISQDQITGLSKITILVLLPSLVVSNTLQHFDPDSLSYWWLLPILGVIMSLVGVLLAYVVFFTNSKKESYLLAIASMQNAGYLVLPIGQVIYPQEFTEFTLYTFLFILGYNPILWSLGKYLITQGDENIKFQFKSIITPPAVANIASLALVLVGWQHLFPKTLINSFDLMGEAAVPMATFILGATLGTVHLKNIPKFWKVFKVLFVKYTLLPLVAFFIMKYNHLGQVHPLLADFIMIQAAAAPATGLILQVRTYGGNVQKVSSVMLITYLVCLVALPFWIALWHLYR